MSDLFRTSENDKSATCSCVQNCFQFFYDQYWQRRVLKLMKSNKFFSIFLSVGLFPLDFGQVNDWPILELHEMITVLHSVACPVVLILFHDRDWQGGVLKLMFIF